MRIISKFRYFVLVYLFNVVTISLSTSLSLFFFGWFRAFHCCFAEMFTAFYSRCDVARWNDCSMAIILAGSMFIFRKINTHRNRLILCAIKHTRIWSTNESKRNGYMSRNNSQNELKTKHIQFTLRSLVSFCGLCIVCPFCVFAYSFGLHIERAQEKKNISMAHKIQAKLFSGANV